MRRILYWSMVCLPLTACAEFGKAPTMKDDPFKASDQQISALTDKEQNLLRLARSTRAGGDEVAAAKLYRDAMNLSKGSITAHLELADLLGKQKDYNGVLNVLRAAATQQPKNADVLRLIGNTQLAAQTPVQALESFNKAIELAPKDGRNYSGKGVALDTMGKHAEAQDVYREGLKVTPKDNDYLNNNLALSLILDSKYEDAITLLEPLVTSENASPTSRQNLALAYGLTGKKDKALEMGLKDLSRKEAEENLKFYTRYLQEAPAKKTEAPVEKVESKPLPKALPPKKDALLKPETPAKPKAAEVKKEEPTPAAKEEPKKEDSKPEPKKNEKAEPKETIPAAPVKSAP